MRINTEWLDYKIIRSGDGYKLEEYSSKIRLLRPDPLITWKASKQFDFKRDCDAYFLRSRNEGGKWFFNNDIENDFKIAWRNFSFSLKIGDFKHVGVFPEQAYNWDRIIEIVSRCPYPLKILNLFAYTGGATLAALSSGAFVCHVDAAKTMCERAKLNVKNSNLDITRARFIVDDCLKFVNREISRKSFYDAIIMDPPSYGHGARGEVWQIEDKINELLEQCEKILTLNPKFFLVNSYTKGITSEMMRSLLNEVFGEETNIDSYEIGLDTEEQGVKIPCGVSTFLEF